jgi:hypothetical protein
MERFRLVAAVPATPSMASFATAVFSIVSSNGLWVQVVDPQLKIGQFVVLAEEGLPSIRYDVPHMTRGVGQNTVYAFVRVNRSIVAGEKNQIEHALREESKSSNPARFCPSPSRSSLGMRSSCLPRSSVWYQVGQD